MSAIIGIDPGRTGYIAAVDSDGVRWSEKNPQTPEYLALVLGEHLLAPVMVERQHAMHGQGVSSTFTTAFGYGQIVGVLAGLGMRYELVRACDWQRVMLRGEGKAKGKELKQLYVAVAERTWPTISFRGPRGGLLDGKAAACLIAEYGRRVVIGA